MRWLNNVLIAFAVLLILVGAQAAFLPFEGHKSSMISFIAGSAAGLLLLASVALSFTNPRIGRIGALVVCLLLMGNFGGAYLSKHETYPALVLLLTSFAVAGCLVAGHFIGMLNRKELGREPLAPFAETQRREREESAARREEPKA